MDTTDFFEKGRKTKLVRFGIDALVPIIRKVTASLSEEGYTMHQIREIVNQDLARICGTAYDESINYNE